MGLRHRLDRAGAPRTTGWGETRGRVRPVAALLVRASAGAASCTSDAVDVRSTCRTSYRFGRDGVRRVRRRPVHAQGSAPPRSGSSCILVFCHSCGHHPLALTDAARSLGRYPGRGCRIQQIPFFGRICGRGVLGTPAASPGGPCAGTRQASALKSVRAAPRTAAEKTRSCAIRPGVAASRRLDHSSRRCVKGSGPKGFLRWLGVARSGR